MNTGIYYFSATGNSLKVARDLAKELGGADVIPITKTLKNTAELPYDVVGIVFPVYMFGLPLIVADFLKVVRPKKDAYIFCVATYGGLMGRALNLAKQMLSKRGIAFDSGFAVRMPGNYTPLYEAIPEEKQNHIFDKEKIRIKEITDAVRQKKTGILEEGALLPSLLIYLLAYRLGASQVRKGARGFWVNEKCTSCGLCEKVCPVANIEMKNKKPHWFDHCEQCLACLQWCPVAAIEYKKSTAGKKRYRHPAIKAEDIMAQH
ncbi:MAG: EFR1 family ferrodoxin [Candidatus Omnitrophica bacterium]|nr:EFR1 family ferrodoxin [Candidatus Omnitrophota bacterium]